MVNTSLAKFSKVTRGLWISGLGLWVVVILIQLAVGRGIQGGNGDAFVFGLFSGPLLNFLISVGAILLGLSIFSAFLRIAAKAIIEGLGGNINRIESATPMPGPLAGWSAAGEESVTSKPVANSETKRLEEVSDYVKNPMEWAQRNLSNSNFEWWEEYGNPDLTSWISSGKPDLKIWLKNSKL